jgi:hypothetical protein
LTVDPRRYEMLRAMANANHDQAIAVADEVDDADWPGGDLVLGVAFAHAVHTWFGSRPDRRQIQQLAAEAISGQDDGPSIAEVQHHIRAVLDEPHLLEYTNPDRGVLVHILVLATLLPRIVRGEAVEQLIGEVMLDVVRLLTPPVGLGASPWRKT